MPAPLPGILLLDLGRVLFDIDFDRCFAHWAASARDAGRQVDAATLRARFTELDAFERHERGELACDAFFTMLCEQLQIELEADAVRAGWNAIFGPDVAGLRHRLLRLAEHRALHVLSNTNRTHAAHFRVRYRTRLEPIGVLFTSHELGMRKPEARIYDHVVRELDTYPQDVLFLDDNAANLEAAAARGLQTLHVPGPDHTCALLDAMLESL